MPPQTEKEENSIEKTSLFGLQKRNCFCAKIPSIMNEFFLASYQVKAHTNFPAFVARSIAIKRNHNAASLNELHINV